MASRVRVAMIGAGVMANMVHYPSLASFSDVEFAGICDIRPDRLHATADKYAIPAERRYTDYRQMVTEVAPDAVYIIGQPEVMYHLAVWCLQQGQNVYFEKPLGITLHQARNLAYLAERHGCITQVSFQRRTCPMVVQLHAQCLARGPITHAVCRFYKHLPVPHLDTRDHMMDDGVHAIDTLRWMCGGEVVRVEGTTKRLLTPDINFIAATLHFNNGSLGIVLNSWTSGRRIFAVEMHAPGIAVEAEHEGRGVVYADGDTQGVSYDTRAVAGSDELYVYGGFQAKNREFIDCVKAGTLPASHFGDAAKTMEVAERILAQGLLAG
jgi:virulence factor